MTTNALIELLRDRIRENPAIAELPVVIAVTNNDGCESCGYGETSSDKDVVGASDLETRLVLSTDY